MSKISVVGLGKLGLPLAAVLKAAGHFVIGVDTSHPVIERTNRRETLSTEPELKNLLQDRAGGQLYATSDDILAAMLTDYSFIMVPTPSGSNHLFSSEYVLDAARAISYAIRCKERPHVVVVVSTVTPGAMEGEILQALEQGTCSTNGNLFYLIYSPEFVALGNVVDGMRRPDTLLIGVQDPNDVIPTEFMDILASMAPTATAHIMSWREAEIAKLMLNTALTFKASLANGIAELSMETGCDSRRILHFIGSDRRIGPKFFKPGPAPGGPCLPRDVRCALAYSTGKTDSDFLNQMLFLIDEFFASQAEWIALQVLGFHPSRVGIAGWTYKQGTPVTEESFAFRVTTSLKQHAQVLITRSEAEALGAKQFEGKATIVDDQEFRDTVDCLILGLPMGSTADFQEYKSLKVVIDPWACLERWAPESLQVWQWGVG